MKQNIENPEYKKKIITIPNILSLFRLLLIPGIFYFYLGEKSIIKTLIVLIISGITDVADGFIARKFGMVSDFGKAIDPVADKFTQIATLFCLAEEYPTMKAAFILLVIKECFTGMSAFLAYKSSGEIIGADWYGKITTVLIYFTSIMHIVWKNIPEFISNQSIGICFGMMIVAFIHYNLRYLNVVKNNRKKKV